MVPSAVVLLERLPLTANGKLDRKALPKPEEEEETAARPFVPPRGETERLVAEVMAELLGLERVGRDESFFDLGGHSLLATRLVSRLRERCGVELPLEGLFRAASVAAVAQAVEARLWAAAPPPGSGKDSETAGEREEDSL